MSSPSAPQASLVRGLWLSRISCCDKLPVPTCPAWLCTHSPFTGRKKGFWKKHLQSEKKPEREAVSVGELRLQAHWTRERMEEHREWETPTPFPLWISAFPITWWCGFDNNIPPSFAPYVRHLQCGHWRKRSFFSNAFSQRQIGHLTSWP